MEENPVRVLVVGSINMDLVFNVDTMPRMGETVLGLDYAHVPGGKGANQAVASARLGAKVTMCGRIGNDENGRFMLNSLKANGVDTKYIKTDSATFTGLASVVVDALGNNQIIVFSGANSKITKADVKKALSECYDIVLLQLETELKIVYYTCKLAALKGIPVVLDAGPSVEMELEKLTGVSVISPNKNEIENLVGVRVEDEESARHAAIALYNKVQTKYIVLKLGSQGALLYDGKRCEVFPAFKVDVVDTTGAGDAFTASFAVKMAKYQSARKAIKYANAVGALCVTERGAQPSLPTAERVFEYINSGQP